MISTRPSKRKPKFSTVTGLVAKGLGISEPELVSSFRKAQPGDLPALLELQRQERSSDGSASDQTRYHGWRYGLGQIGQTSFAQLFVLMVANQLIGVIGVEEFRLCYMGQMFASGCPMDILVAARFRDLGIGPWICMALCQKYPTLLSMGVNSNSAALARDLFFPVKERSLYQYALDVTPYLSRRLRSRGVAAIAGPAVNGLLAGRRVLRRRGSTCSVAIKEVSDFDPVVERLLAQTTKSDAVTVVRTLTHLRWRYCANPRQRYRIFAATREGDWLGYVVFREGEDSSGDQQVHLADWLVDRDEGADVLGALLTEVVSYARKSRSAYVSAFSNDAMANSVLLRFGFFRRAESGTVTSMYAQDAEVEKQFAQTDQWSITEFGDDTDGV